MIITLEDPVEYKIPGINQSQISVGGSYNFAEGLRSILRQDPDIIMVGEVRDLETAEVAINAALTGHLMFTTMHTNSAAGAVPRLLAMGVKPYLLAPAINAIEAQRLVRKLCEKCKTKAELDNNTTTLILNELNKIAPESGFRPEMKNELVFHTAPGCPACNGLGYKGRIGLFEVLTMSQEIEKELSSGISKEVTNCIENVSFQNQEVYFEKINVTTKVQDENVLVLVDFPIEIISWEGSASQIKDFQNMFDVVQDTWKAWTLGIFPAYHARNFVSNKWNNFLANVWNPKYYGQARKLQAGMKAGKLNPQELALINKAQELGVLNTGWYGGDIPDELLQNFMQGTGRFLQKTIGKENPMVKFGNKFGTMIENNDRLAHFLSKIGEGLTPEEASLSVKKYLFDYTELTNFEKDVLKRVFPFYTWSRKNIPLQIENIIKQPGKYAAIVKAKNAIESGDVGRPNELYMSDWMQRNAPVYIKTDPKTGNSLYFLMGSWIAAADLLKIGNSLTEIVSMITPLFRVPAEVLIPGGGYSFVFDQKIENVPGESSEFLGKLMRKKQIHILKSIRLLNEIDKFMKPQTPHKLDLPMSTKITRFMTGIKLYPYNEEKSRLYWERDIINRINQLKSTITRGYKIGESTEELQKYYQQIEKEQSKLSQ